MSPKTTRWTTVLGKMLIWPDVLISSVTGVNEISLRTYQENQSQWNFAKSLDTFCPLGPAVVPLSAIKDIGEIKIGGKLTGVVVQDGSTRRDFRSYRKGLSEVQ